MTEQKRQPDANDPLIPISDTPGLPRVLLIGDSISIGYTLPARRLLEGVANVHRPPDNCRNTQHGLENLDSWIGDGPWDVIHFNFGLHDLVCRDESGEGTESPDGKLNTPPDEYRGNITRIVARLKQTGAVLIWCSTTPIPAGAGFRRQDDEIGHNRIAAEVMEADGIAINDLYAFAKERQARIQLPSNVHFSPEGSEDLARPVVDAIRQALAERL